MTVKELGYRPEPYCIADALMYADGKPIVEITNMSLRLTRADAGEVGGDVASVEPSGRRAERCDTSGLRLDARPALYDSATILAFANGKPSEAFGEPYRSSTPSASSPGCPGRRIQFLDRVTAVAGEPWVLKAGGGVRGRVRRAAGRLVLRARTAAGPMPFGVLLEIALQPCGWLAAYCGSALTSPEDLAFRNLGGKATQFRAGHARQRHARPRA